MRKVRVAVGYAVLAVALAWATVWAIKHVSDRPQATVSPTPETSATQEVAAVRQVTLTLTVGGVDARVAHTCVVRDAISMCEAAVNGVWSTKVTVPAGTLVTVTGLDGVVPPRCSISDESAQITYVPGNISSACEWVAQ